MSGHRLNMDNLRPSGAANRKQWETSVSTHRSALRQRDFNGQAKRYYSFFHIHHTEENVELNMGLTVLGTGYCQFAEGFTEQRFLKVKQPPVQSQKSSFPLGFDHFWVFLQLLQKNPKAFFMRYQKSNKLDSSSYRNPCHISGYGHINIPINTSSWVWVYNVTIKLCSGPKLCKT